MTDPITQLVVLLFSGPGVALAVAGAILAISVGLVVYTAIFEHRPITRALIENWNLLASLRGNAAFSANLDEVDRRLSRAPAVLTRSWRSYRRFLALNGRGELVSPVRAADVFPLPDKPARTLEWWANIMVGVGLLVTFLGIVAALAESTSAIAAGGGQSGAAVEGALLGLLAIAATKFWTSIAGVLSSIILRIAARQRRSRLEELTADFCDSIDAAVDYHPPERTMIEQLAALDRIEARLSSRPVGEAA